MALISMWRWMDVETLAASLAAAVYGISNTYRAAAEAATTTTCSSRLVTTTIAKGTQLRMKVPFVFFYIFNERNLATL